MDSLNIYWVMIGLSMIIILSYLYNYISRISRVPSVILLIFTGFIISIFLPEDFIDLKPFLEILGAIGLIMIVLEASLDLELKKEKAGIMLKAIASAILLLVINALVIAWLIGFFYSVDFTRSLAYALPLAIMSSAIIIPSIQHLSEHRKEFLIYESAFSDIVGIMFFYFLLDSVDTESTGEIALNITGNVLLTLIVSAILGYLVIALIQKVTGQVKLFLPIAVLILLYSVGKLFHLSSLIFILVFGLMINNRELFFKGSLLKLVNTQSFSETLEDLKVLTLESSFVVRTFFFIVFGMTITADGLNDPLVYVIGFGALIVLYASRFGLVPLLTKNA
ncbi:MAG: cation:proton antiporter, partial [Cyclobacteriaceae bacterium]|nr:cation:proton antiporter [Cyclobacteriaceae bacterium]